MTLTIEHVQVPEPLSPEPSEPPKSPRKLGVIVGWASAAGALVAAGVLGVAVFSVDDSPSKVDTGRVVAEHGSIRAIEHRDELIRHAPSQVVAQNGSIRAIEHRNEQLRQAPSQVVAQNGSIRAIEHRNELLRQAPSQVVAEHGSIRAIEHRDDK
jgi:hypothetical protein